MLWSSKRILGLRVAAMDGPIGSIQDVYCEDEAWSVRYFVVDTGGWLSGRRVLLSPRTIGRPEWDASRIPASLTREQVRNSPLYDEERPISREYEIELAGYYTWHDPMLEPTGVGITPAAVPAVAPRRALHAATVERMPGPHLRSIRDLLGYEVHAREGKIGTADDLILEDDSWRVDRIVVETGSWFSGRKVAVPARYAHKIRWSGQVIYLDISRDDIERAPGFDASEAVNPSLEIHWYDYDGRHHDPATRA